LISSTTYSKPVDIWAIGCILGELTDGQPLFPGENEFDQLYVIQKVMGPLIPEQMEAFQKNQRYVGMKFPDLKAETLEKRYLGKLSRKALSFMKACLKMDPSQRITAAEALSHPYFEGFVPIPNPTVNGSQGEIDADTSLVGSSDIKKHGSQISSTQTTVIHPPQSTTLSIALAQIPINRSQKSPVNTGQTSQDRTPIMGGGGGMSESRY